MRRLLALLLGLWTGEAAAQVVTDAAGLREIGAVLLAEGDAAGARAAAEALLARDPSDLAGLILAAQAALALGDPAAALERARAAHAVAPPGPARFLAARLVARAHADLGQDTRAMIWLRRARGDVPSEEAAADLAEDYRLLAARNPLSVSVAFGVAPSSNINGGSRAETIVLPGLPFEFVLDGEARALSGWRVSAGLSLAWRLREGERDATFLEAQVSGRTYVLSDAARRQAPEARGRDFADVALSVGLVQRWRAETGESREAALSLGQSWFGGEPWLRFGQIAHEREVFLGERDSLRLTGFAEWSGRLDGGGDDWSLGARAAWTTWTAGGDRVTLSAGLRGSLSEVEDTSYRGATFGATFDRRELLLGLRVGAGATFDWRDYPLSAYAFDGRQDRRATLSVSLGLPGLEVWGFEPVLGLEASRTWSDVSLYDREALTLDLGLRSVF